MIDDIRPGAIVPAEAVQVIGQPDNPDFRIEERLRMFAQAMMNTPRSRGISAYHAMVALSACPFPKDHPHYEEWCAGWHHAQAETQLRLNDVLWDNF